MKKDYLHAGRTAQKRQTRESILRAAKEILEQGNEFSLERVAAQAGISRATMYRYYSDKDILSAEAALDLRLLPPEEVVAELADQGFEEMILGIQEYYNGLTVDKEPIFRKYLSVILDADKAVNQRGGRRVRALGDALERKGPDLPAADREHFVCIATLLMGIEAYIVMKDVCGLDNTQAHRTLQWGLRTFLRGLQS